MSVTITDLKIKSSPEITVTDEWGRKIVIKKPNRLAQVNYKIACGNDRDALQEEIFVLPWIVSIDGELVSAPVALVNVKALIQKLDNEGYMAVIKEIARQVDAVTEEGESMEKKAE